MIEQKDFNLVDGGSVYLLVPNTNDAQSWLNKNIGTDAVYLGKGLGIESRYVRQVLDGLMADGFTVEL